MQLKLSFSHTVLKLKLCLVRLKPFTNQTFALTEGEQQKLDSLNHCHRLKAPYIVMRMEGINIVASCNASTHLADYVDIHCVSNLKALDVNTSRTTFVILVGQGPLARTLHYYL